jgi:flagellar hook protein FlgE
MTSAISGLQNFQQRMDVIGNNIANVNTVGFKAARTDLSDSFSQTLRNSSAASADSSGSSAMQIGTGVGTSSIKNLYTQGAVNGTGLGTDLAIDGEGFFVVRDPMSNEVFVTRAGGFQRDGENYLVTSTGQRVQGLNFDNTVAPPTSTYGDIRIDMTGAPGGVNGAFKSFSFKDNGEIHVADDNAKSFVRAQLLLQNFSDPQGLVKRGNSLFSGMGAAGPLGGPLSPTPEAPKSNGLGSIVAGALELANVDLSQEFSSMILAQRAFQANARVITTSDDMLQELVNLKR